MGTQVWGHKCGDVCLPTTTGKEDPDGVGTCCPEQDMVSVAQEGTNVQMRTTPPSHRTSPDNATLDHPYTRQCHTTPFHTSRSSAPKSRPAPTERTPTRRRCGRFLVCCLRTAGGGSFCTRLALRMRCRPRSPILRSSHLLARIAGGRAGQRYMGADRLRRSNGAVGIGVVITLPKVGSNGAAAVVSLPKVRAQIACFVVVARRVVGWPGRLGRRN